jgi:uncharacterized protein YmfQ (DUF2313 family)
MNHADTLKLLFPVELTGVFDDDIELEGMHLDAAQASAECLLNEIYADQTYSLLTDWERVCGLIPATDAQLQGRRDAVVQKLRDIGGLSRAYYISLAATLGWTITIDEYLPFMSGWARSGDVDYDEDVCWIWRVNVAGNAAYSFRSGLSVAGEGLTWWTANDILEALIDELKPAHTAVIFNYE